MLFIPTTLVLSLRTSSRHLMPQAWNGQPFHRRVPLSTICHEGCRVLVDHLEKTDGPGGKRVAAWRDSSFNARELTTCAHRPFSRGMWMSASPSPSSCHEIKKNLILRFSDKCVMQVGLYPHAYLYFIWRMETMGLRFAGSCNFRGVCKYFEYLCGFALLLRVAEKLASCF